MKNVDPRVQTLLKYNLVADEDYKKRLDTLEGDLSLAKTNTDTEYSPNLEVRYGTTKAKEAAIEARKKTIESLQKELDEV